MENIGFSIPVKNIKEVESELERCFGFSISGNMLEEAFSLCDKHSSDPSRIAFTTIKDFCGQKIESVDALSYALSLDEDCFEFLVPENFPANELDSLFGQFLDLEEDDSAITILEIVSLLLYKERRIEMSEVEWMDANYQDYVEHIRPDMLSLFIALKEKKQRNSQGPIDEVRISFGGNKPIHLENNRCWIENMLDHYLHTYLGVSSVEEAQKELDIIYPKKTGRKMNSRFDQYAWGIYQLLCHTTRKPTKQGSVTLEICKFIYEYFRIVDIIHEQEEKDIQNVRSQIVYLIKHFNTIKELKDARQYRLSPNNIHNVEGKYY